MGSVVVSPQLHKVVFFLSACVLAFLYGIATQAFGWFPSSLLRRAWNQAEAVVDSPVDPRWTANRVYQEDGAKTFAPDRVRPALTLVASHWKQDGWMPGLKLIKRDGSTVHEWQVDPTDLFPDSVDRRPRRDVAFERRHIHGFHLFENGDVLLNVEYAGTVRIDACSRPVWRRSTGGHHSIAEGEDAVFWVPGSTHARAPKSERFPRGYPGLDDPIFHDLILRVSETGSILDTIPVLDLLYENGLENHLLKASHSDVHDLTHLNDVEPLPPRLAGAFPGFEAGDLLVSLRNLDLVFVFDPDTREVRWHTSHYTIQQHDPDFLPGGRIGIFDNRRDGTERGTMLGGTRIVALNPQSDSVNVVFPRAGSGSFYTPIMGNWEALESGNLLLTESLAGRIVEVAPDGSYVWQWVHSPYNQSSVPWVTGAKRYRIGVETVASWPCAAIDSNNERERAS